MALVDHFGQAWNLLREAIAKVGQYHYEYDKIIVHHNKIIFLSSPFPIIPILGTNCCYNVIFVLC